MAFKKQGAKPAQVAQVPNPPAATQGVDLAAMLANPAVLQALQAMMAGQTPQVPQVAAPKGNVGRPRKVAGPVADTVKIDQSPIKPQTHVEIRFSLNGVTCAPDQGTRDELKANGFKFNPKDNDPRWYGFAKLVPDSLK